MDVKGSHNVAFNGAIPASWRGGAEENHETPQHSLIRDRESNPGSSEYETGVLTTTATFGQLILGLFNDVLFTA
jgi:hypothetical protein